MQGTELRYYEIQFIKLLNNFFSIYKPDKMKQFIEMACFLSEASTLSVGRAMQQVMMNDPVIRIRQPEYIVCLSEYTDMSLSKIRLHLKCSPNTVRNTLDLYERGQLQINPRMEYQQSLEVMKVMKAIKKLSTIY